MKSATLFLFTVVLTGVAAGELRADSFRGITPGVTSRAEVGQAFGQPVKSSALGEWQEFDGQAFDAKKIIVHYDSNGAVVRKVNIYPQQEAGAVHYRKWMSLAGAPEVDSADIDGSRVEIYRSRGVVLKLKGPAVTDKVEIVSHIAGPSSPVQSVQHRAANSSANNEIVYIGIDYDCQPDGVHVAWVYPGSPAKRGKLISGDIITSIEGRPLRSQEDFFSAVSKLPSHQPLRFVVRRRGKTYETKIALETRPRQDVVREVEQEKARRRQIQHEENAAKVEQRQELSASFGKMVSTIQQEMEEFNRD